MVHARMSATPRPSGSLLLGDLLLDALAYSQRTFALTVHGTLLLMLFAWLLGATVQGGLLDLERTLFPVLVWARRTFDLPREMSYSGSPTPLILAVWGALSLLWALLAALWRKVRGSERRPWTFRSKAVLVVVSASLAAVAPFAIAFASGMRLGAVFAAAVAWLLLVGVGLWSVAVDAVVEQLRRR
jgi:hypothetical protein